MTLKKGALLVTSNYRVKKGHELNHLASTKTSIRSVPGASTGMAEGHLWRLSQMPVSAEGLLGYDPNK